MKDVILSLIIKGCGRLPLAGARWLGTCVGNLLYYTRSRAWAITQRNAAIAFPHLSDEEAKRFVRQSLIDAAKTGFEAFSIWGHSSEWLERHIVGIDGGDLLRSYMADGKGLVVLAPHHGNWEAMNNFLNAHGAATAIYRPMVELPRVDAIMLNGRRKAGMALVKTERSGVVQLFKALKRGELVMILPDQVPDRDAGGVVADFFGHPAKTMTLVEGLIQRSGAHVCGCYAVRVPKGFKIVVVPPDARIFSQDPVESARGLNATIESCVADAPTQYQWEYKRFKSLQEPFCDVYKAQARLSR